MSRRGRDNVRQVTMLFVAGWLVACSGDDGAPAATPTDSGVHADSGAEAGPPPPAPELGTGDHSANSVVLTEIATSADKLDVPRDLAFNVDRPDELWIVNGATDSVTIEFDASTEGRTSEWRKDGYALHFMAKPAAIAFGADPTTFDKPGTFATCGESRNTYGDQTAANDFMGPALWSSDLSVFAEQNPYGLGSHIFMSHMSPLCMGVTHESENRFWVFEGLTNSIGHYDFVQDHGIGADDHSWAQYWRYADGQVKYVPGVPSHVQYDADTQLLYIADSGHSRVASLDTTTGTVGAAMASPEPMAFSVMMDGTNLTDVVSAGSGLLQTPSGIKLHDGLLYVTDNATSRISAFSPADGSLQNYLDTGLAPGSLAGLTFGPDGKIYFVDMTGNRVLRVDVPPR